MVLTYLMHHLSSPEIKDNNGIFPNRDVDEMFSMAFISSLAIRFVLILHKFVEKRGFRRICLI